MSALAGVLILFEVGFLYIVNKYNEKISTIQEQTAQKVQNLKAKAPECIDNTRKPTINQSAATYVESIESYVTNSQTPKKKLFSTLMYEGTVQAVSFPKKESVTLNIVDSDGKRIEQYLDFPIRGFRVYEKVKDGSLSVRKITDLQVKDKVSVRETEEVLTNTMKLQDMTGYTEIVILPASK